MILLRFTTRPTRAPAIIHTSAKLLQQGASHGGPGSTSCKAMLALQIPNVKLQNWPPDTGKPSNRSGRNAVR